MNVQEVRDGFIKFNADENIYLSSFVQVKGSDKNYIAQVTKKTGDTAYAKILFLMNNNSIENYDKTLPPEEAEVVECTKEIIDDSISIENPVIAGKTQNGDLIKTDLSVFDKKILISIDNTDSNNIIVKNLTKQFEYNDKNTIIIDSQGIINAHKYLAGVDFKLPLDTSSLIYMYNECLNDTTSDSKSMIVDIFKDLSEYSKTVDFLPFNVLKTIVDDMVDKSHVFKLLVLKNKLQKFSNAGYFANNAEEVLKLDRILNSKCAVIDVSKLDAQFANYFISYLYEKLSEKNNTNVILELSNVITKKNLKNVICDSPVSTTTIINSNFKYLNDIKNYFDNFIITKSLQNNKAFNIYSSFLQAMNDNEALIVGEGTNYIPFVSKVEIIEDKIETSKIIQSEQTTEEELNQSIESEASDEEISEIAEEINDEDVIQPKEELEYTNNDYIDEISIDESEIEDSKSLSESEIIANIDERTESVIADITENHEIPENISMFDDENEAPSISEEDLDKNRYSEELSEEDLNDAGINSAEEQLEENAEGLYVQDNEQPEADSIVIENEENEDFSQLDTDLNEIDDSEFNSEDSLISEDNTGFASDEEPLEEPEEINVNDIDLLDDYNENEVSTDEQVDFSDEQAMENLPDIPEDVNISSADGAEEEISLGDVDSIDFNTEEEVSGLDDIVEIDDDVIEPDVLIDISDDSDIQEEMTDNIDEQIVKDVDKVFTTRADDDISENDLDLIDELNSSEIEDETIQADDLEEFLPAEDEGIIQKEEIPEIEDRQEDSSEILETKGSTTPIVPVYDAEIPPEDMVISDPIQQGDAVTHVKYGSGVVEKMIKYGNKTLYSINFDNIGRRLLDPTLTEIKKV